MHEVIARMLLRATPYVAESGRFRQVVLAHPVGQQNHATRRSAGLQIFEDFETHVPFNPEVEDKHVGRVLENSPQRLCPVAQQDRTWKPGSTLNFLSNPSSRIGEASASTRPQSVGCLVMT